MNPRHRYHDHWVRAELTIGDEVKRGVEWVQGRCVPGWRVKDSRLGQDNTVRRRLEEFDVRELDTRIVDAVLGDSWETDVDPGD